MHEPNQRPREAQRQPGGLLAEHRMAQTKRSAGWGPWLGWANPKFNRWHIRGHPASAEPVPDTEPGAKVLVEVLGFGGVVHLVLSWADEPSAPSSSGTAARRGCDAGCRPTCSRAQANGRHPQPSQGLGLASEGPVEKPSDQPRDQRATPLVEQGFHWMNAVIGQGCKHCGAVVDLVKPPEKRHPVQGPVNGKSAGIPGHEQGRAVEQGQQSGGKFWSAWDPPPKRPCDAPGEWPIAKPSLRHRCP